MSVEEITAVVEQLIRELLPEFSGAILPDSNFDEIGIDSLSRVDLVVGAENAFAVNIPDSELHKLLTVRDLADFVTAAKASEGVPS